MTVITKEQPVNRVQSVEEEYKRRLVEANRYLVEETAQRYVDFGIPLDTLMAEGDKGLKISAEKYDGSVDAPFSLLAKWWIKRKISDRILAAHNLK